MGRLTTPSGTLKLLPRIWGEVGLQKQLTFGLMIFEKKKEKQTFDKMKITRGPYN